LSHYCSEPDTAIWGYKGSGSGYREPNQSGIKRILNRTWILVGHCHLTRILFLHFIFIILYLKRTAKNFISVCTNKRSKT
jgi:hypothetical protein